MSQNKYSRPWSFRIKDILDAIENIQEFTEGMTFAEFDKNRMVLDAVIRNFEIIGEAGNHIPIAIQERYPQIPWRQLISMRNSLIHNILARIIALFGILYNCTFQNLKAN